MIRRSKAFTLVEVTLAIAVGTLLLAGAIAAFKSYRDQARISQAKLNMATLNMALSGYKLRQGTFMRIGYRGQVQSHSANSPSVTLNSPPLTDALAGPMVLCFGVGPDALKGTVQAVMGSVVTLTAAITVSQTGAQVRSGILGNVDDQCNRLLPVTDDSSVDGYGLGDPWTGYTRVRPMTNANPAVPGHNDRGFTYVAGQNVTWGGLAYDNSNGSVEYVLPNPESANKPPAALGYFPGDPPVNWGR